MHHTQIIYTNMQSETLISHTLLSIIRRGIAFTVHGYARVHGYAQVHSHHLRLPYTLHIYTISEITNPMHVYAWYHASIYIHPSREIDYLSARSDFSAMRSSLV